MILIPFSDVVFAHKTSTCVGRSFLEAVAYFFFLDMKNKIEQKILCVLWDLGDQYRVPIATLSESPQSVFAHVAVCTCMSHGPAFSLVFVWICADCIWCSTHLYRIWQGEWPYLTPSTPTLSSTCLPIKRIYLYNYYY